jgi:hypothetical protein
MAINEFLTQAEQCAKIRNSLDEDTANIVTVKVCEEALQFIKGSDNLLRHV